MKKFLSVLIVVLLLVSALPMGTAFASDVVTYDVKSKDGEDVYLEFTPEADGYYVFYTDCEYDTSIIFYDESDEDFFLMADNISDDNLNFRLKVRLEKGVTYTLAVCSWELNTSEFTVFVEPTEKFVVSGEVVKEPDQNYVYKNAEYDSFSIVGMEIEFTLSDGTKETVKFSDNYSFDMYVDGEIIDYGLYDFEGKLCVYCGEILVEWEYNVLPNPVESMEYTGAPLQAVENESGFYNEETNMFFYSTYFIFRENDTAVINYTDGTCEEIVISDSNSAQYPVYSYIDNQIENPWTVGGENYVTIEYLGNTLEVPVELLPEGSERDDSYNSDDYFGEDDFEDYPDEPAEPIYAGTPYTVNLEDDMAAYLEFTPEEDGYYIFSSKGDCDTYVSVYDDEDWDLGYGEDTSKDDANFFLRLYLEKDKTYYLEVGAYDEPPCTFDVLVEPTDVYAVSGSITKEPDKNYVYKNLEYETFIPDGMEVTYNMSDGSTCTVALSRDIFFSHAYGAPVAFEYDTELNEVYIYCESIELTYAPEVIENPIDHIEYTGAPLMVSESDGWYDESLDSYYYVFWFRNNDTLKLYYKDGTSKELIIEKDDDYPIIYWTSQYEVPWTIGGENYVYIEYLGETISVPVEVVKGSDKPDDPVEPDNPNEPDNPEFDYSADRAYVIGDANSDGKINVKDATQIQKAIASLVTLNATQEAAADADGNGKVNIKDATAIQKHAAGMDTGFLIGETIDGTEPPVTEAPVTEPPVTEPPVTEPPVTEAPVTEPPVTEPSDSNSSAVDSSLVYSDDKVKIYFKEVTSKGVVFTVENLTDVTVTIQADAIAIDQISTNDIIMSDDVAPRSTGDVVAKCNIPFEGDVGTISGQLRIIDFDRSFETYNAKFVDVKINSAVSVTKPAVPDTLVYSDSNVNIYYKEVTSKGMVFTVENLTDIVITIQADAVSVNGMSTDNIIMSDDVAPHSTGDVVAKCDLPYEDDVNTVSGQLRVIDFNNLFSSYDATFVNITV